MHDSGTPLEPRVSPHVARLLLLEQRFAACRVVGRRSSLRLRVDGITRALPHTGRNNFIVLLQTTSVREGPNLPTMTGYIGCPKEGASCSSCRACRRAPVATAVEQCHSTKELVELGAAGSSLIGEAGRHPGASSVRPVPCAGKEAHLPVAALIDVSATFGAKRGALCEVADGTTVLRMNFDQLDAAWKCASLGLSACERGEVSHIGIAVECTFAGRSLAMFDTAMAEVRHFGWQMKLLRGYGALAGDCCCRHTIPIVSCVNGDAGRSLTKMIVIG